MRRIGTGGATILLLAVGAFAVSSASASEYGQCLSHKKGEYTGGGCNTKSVKPHKGHFEWYPGPAASCLEQKKGEYTSSTCSTKSAKPHKGKFEKQGGPGFTATGNGATVGEVPGYPAVECVNFSDVGEVTGVTTAIAQLTFTGCKAAGFNCTTAGQATGTIKTPVLDINLRQPAEVAEEYVSKAGPTGYSYEFRCEALSLVRVAGSVTGNSGILNAPSTTHTVEFAIAPEEQDPLTEIDIGFGWEGPFGTSYVLTATITSASPIELRYPAT